jgi:hypothetical protein
VVRVIAEDHDRLGNIPRGQAFGSGNLPRLKAMGWVVKVNSA